jgi:hypothetical protein
MTAMAVPLLMLTDCATNIVSVIECFETDGGVNYGSDRLI